MVNRKRLFKKGVKALKVMLNLVQHLPFQSTLGDSDLHQNDND